MPRTSKEEPSNVVPIADARFKRQGNKAAPDLEALRISVISRLSRPARMKEGQAEQLQIPDRLFVTGDDSFSSDPSLGISGVSASLISKSALPRNLPEYAIELSSHGSNTFCTLVDKNRKVIVFASVRNMFVETGSWDAFFAGLSEALERAQKEGKNFSFIVSNEGSVAVV